MKAANGLHAETAVGFLEYKMVTRTEGFKGRGDFAR